jgi:hypothetical protein
MQGGSHQGLSARHRRRTSSMPILGPIAKNPKSAIASRQTALSSEVVPGCLGEQNRPSLQ